MLAMVCDTLRQVPTLFSETARGVCLWRLIVDQLCREKGIRMIVVDRPGCGATTPVGTEDRFKTSSRESRGSSYL